MQPLVSVIMPIYNASSFLKESLGGLLGQTYRDMEIICVNDGSTDDSLEIIKSYAVQDERIIIIDKANSGYGNTMNEGIKVASGKYIGILEPDDFMDVQMYEKLVGTAEQYEADVVKSNYYEYTTKDGKSAFLEVLQGQEYNKVVSAWENEYVAFMRPCIWSAIYRREFLVEKNIHFNETPGASYQDMSFAFKVWTSAQRVVFIPDAFYHYRIDNENSSVNSSSKVFCIFDEFQSMQSFLNADYKKKKRFSKLFQVLKIDSYLWNLERISDEHKEEFSLQVALEYKRAFYDGVLDCNYFDEYRWNKVQEFLKMLENITLLSEQNAIKQTEISRLETRVSDLENSHSYKVGHALMFIPGKMKRILGGLKK